MKNKTLKKIAALAAAFAMLTAGTQAITPYTGQKYAITASAAAYGFTEDMTDAERVALAAEMVESGKFPVSEGGLHTISFDMLDTNGSYEESFVYSLPNLLIELLNEDEDFLKDSGVTATSKVVKYNLYYENAEDLAEDTTIFDYEYDIILNCGNVSQTVHKYGRSYKTAASVFFDQTGKDEIKTIINNIEYTNDTSLSDIESAVNSFVESYNQRYGNTYTISPLGKSPFLFAQRDLATSEKNGYIYIVIQLSLSNFFELNDRGYYYYIHSFTIPKLSDNTDTDNKNPTDTDTDNKKPTDTDTDNTNPDNTNPSAPSFAPTFYNTNVIGGNAVVTGDRTAGSIMTVTVPVGYEAVVASGGNRLAVITDGTGTFTMPAADVTVRVDLSITAYSMVHYPNSYIFCYDSGMNHIRTNSSRYGINGTGDVTVKLGADYAGRSVTLYSGRKSTANKVDEGVLDSSGRITFTVQGGKNFTLIVE